MSMRVHLRGLLRSPAFGVTAVLVLGLGLGVNMILFNTAYALLWRPLGFARPGRLVTVNGRSASGDLSATITGKDAWTLSQQAAVAEIGLEGSGRLVTLFNGDELLEMTSAAVSSGYFRALGLRPVAGRLFGDEEDLGTSGEQRAVLTESAWRTHFGSDPSVVGRAFPLQDGARRSLTRIVGILPGAATLPFAPDAGVLRPIPWKNDAVRFNYGDALYRSVVRLRPGPTLAEASARIDAALQERAWGRHWVEPLRAALAPVNQRTLFLLYGSACLLLLLTCANLASLFVARSMARMHETSVHMALGATRWRLLRAHFEEALLVCAAGTALAFTVENWARPLIPRFLPELKRVGPEVLDTGPVLLAFGILMCLAVSLIVAVACGGQLRESGLGAALSQGGRGESHRAGRFRAALAASQLAIVLTLLTMAGLVGRSFLAATQSDPGIDPKGIVTFQASFPGVRAALPAIQDLASRIASVPGTKSVTFAAESPVGPPAISTVTAAHGGNLTPNDPMIPYRQIGPAYFETLGARMTAGRTLSADDVAQSRPVVILNQAASRLLFPGENALGRTVHSGFMGLRSVVVGVVRDIRSEGLDKPSAPMVYMPYRPGWGLRFTVRTGSSLVAFVPMLKARAADGNSGILLQRFKPLRESLDDTVRGRSTAGVLMGGFALLGLVVSSVGLYGTLAAQVERRRREIGVRIALGATVRTVVAAILAQGMRIVAVGALAGLAGSAAAAKLIQRQLYQVSPLDLVSFLLALLLLAGTALAACLIPAFKAARVDPIQTLNVQ